MVFKHSSKKKSRKKIGCGSKNGTIHHMQFSDFSFFWSFCALPTLLIHSTLRILAKAARGKGGGGGGEVWGQVGVG